MSAAEEGGTPVTVVLGLDRTRVAAALRGVAGELTGSGVLVLPADAAGVRDLVAALEAAGDRMVDPRAVPPHLTPRESEVLGMVVTGLTCRQVASRLFLSRRTVENHVQRIMRKLAARNRVELLRAAMAYGLA